MAYLKDNLSIDQGATFRKSYVWSSTTPATTPISLTGYTARMMLRTKQGDVTPVLSLTNVQNASGQIILGGSLGTLQIYLTDAATMSLVKGGVYDLEVISPTGDVSRLLQGSFSVSPNVTR